MNEIFNGGTNNISYLFPFSYILIFERIFPSSIIYERHFNLGKKQIFVSIPLLSNPYYKGFSSSIIYVVYFQWGNKQFHLSSPLLVYHSKKGS
jgi:hypothetical protein